MSYLNKIKYYIYKGWMIKMKIKNVNKLTKKQQNDVIKNESLSKSSKIKTLFEAGLSIKEIATLLEIRYNFAYNVVSNYIITSDVEVIKEEKTNKKQIVIDMFNQGKSNKEIAIELKTNYNYVYKIVKEYKSSLQEVVNK